MADSVRERGPNDRRSVDGFDQHEFREASQLPEAMLLRCDVAVETLRLVHAFGPGRPGLPASGGTTTAVGKIIARREWRTIHTP